MKDLRSPLAKAKGLGTSPEASHHFWLQRVSALALIPLVLWFGFSVAALPEMTYEVLTAWLQSPFNTVMMIMLLVVGLHHGQFGMQVIIEDYVHAHDIRIIGILTVKFISYFMMALGVFSVIKIALGGA